MTIKKIFLLLLLCMIPGFAFAECVNNIDTVTGRTCIVVRPITVEGSSAQGWLGLQTGQTQIPNPLSGQTPCTNPKTGGNLTYCPLEPLYPGESMHINQVGGLGSIFNNLFRLLISLGALIAVVTLVIGGVMYMTSEATHTKDEAKKRMANSIYGLLLLAASFVILSTINPQLTLINLDPKKITGQTPSQVINNNFLNTNNTQGAGGALEALQLQKAGCERDQKGTFVIDSQGVGVCYPAL